MLELDVGVVGGGTAGAAAALFLARAGHRVTLYERVPDPSPVGAGILLQPSGLAVLARLGLLDRVLARGARIDGIHVETLSGRNVLALAYRDLAPELHGIGLHRGVLFEALWDACRTAGVQLRPGVEVGAIARPSPGRRTLLDKDGASLAEHSLVLLTDGARSALRMGVVSPRRSKRYPWGALWVVAEEAGHTPPDKLFQCVAGTARMLGFLPTGLGPGSRATQLTSLFWSIPEASLPLWRARGLDAWKDEVRAMWPGSEGVLRQVTSTDRITFAPYYDVVMSKWDDGDAVAVLGDSGHAMSPQLGQGANLALVDAATMAASLKRAGDLPSALRAYSLARRDGLRYYARVTRWLTPFFQSRAVPLGWLRDAFMAFTCRLPPVRRLMLHTVAGVQTGFFRAARLPASREENDNRDERANRLGRGGG